jgi:putative hydrolase of the HAD superfamily
MTGAGPAVRAVLFDFYDTLACLEPEAADSLRRRAAQVLGLPPEVYFKAWRRHIDAFMRGEIDSTETMVRRVLADLGREATPEALAEAVRLEELARQQAVRLYPGAGAVLRSLRQRGYRLGLVSNVSPLAAGPLDRLGLRGYFDAVILSFEVGLLKPDPAIFKLACRRLGVNPAEAAFVADGGFGELDAAAALGMLTVRVSLPNQRPDYGSSRRWDVEIEDLRALLAIFPDLEPGRWSRNKSPAPSRPAPHH